MTKPEVGASNDTWGGMINGDLDVLDLALVSHHFAEDSVNHSGLDFAHKSGVVRYRAAITLVAGGVVPLANDAVNYIEVLPSTGAVSANAVGFTLGNIPLFQVTTAGGAITVVADQRSFLGVDSDYMDKLTAKGDLLVYDGAVYQKLAVGLNGDSLVADSGQASGLKWAQRSHGIAFYIDDVLATDADALSIIIPMNVTITGGKIEVSTAPTGANLICDIHQMSTGLTIFTTQANRPTITVGNTSAAIVAPDIVDINQGDTLTLALDHVGSSYGGMNLRLTLYCKERA
jgi:hypothetical protein